MIDCMTIDNGILNSGLRNFIFYYMQKAKAKIQEMDSLPDTKGDRQIKYLRPPVHKPLTSALLYGTSSSYCKL